MYENPSASSLLKYFCRDIMKSNIGIIGLGTMGAALALNMRNHGYVVSLWNRTTQRTTDFIEKNGSDSFHVADTFEDFIESLEKPRRVLIMVPAGEATTAVLNELMQVLEPQDTIMDGGNAFFETTEQYQALLAEKEIHYLGCGVSGGEEGALRGPSCMPGGTEHAYQNFRGILESISAKDFNGQPCVSHMGRGGAGHYVKMVHNGIEYAEMQMLAEAQLLLRELHGLSYEEVADIFAKWNEGPLGSFLVEASVEVLRKKEEGKALLDLILDKAAQKGTGLWTSQEALKLGVPTPSITGAVFMRAFSWEKESRVELEKIHPKDGTLLEIPLEEFLHHLEQALFLSRIANFEQGFALLRTANAEYEFGLNFPEIVRVWQGGCIIRSRFLKDLHEEWSQREIHSLYQCDLVKEALATGLNSWKKIVETGVNNSLPVSAFSTALTHFETSTRGRSYANFIQGLRDFFGSHGYERVDQPGNFHSKWFNHD